MALFIDFYAVQTWDMSSLLAASSVSRHQMVYTSIVLSSKGPPWSRKVLRSVEET